MRSPQAYSRQTQSKSTQSRQAAIKSARAQGNEGTADVEATLELRDVTLHIEGRIVVDRASLSLTPGSTTSLLGPSGCGKTTLLRAIAGLMPVTSGAIYIDHNAVVDAKTFVPPERRSVGMVFQDGALFPHLTVAENVAFGLRGHSKVDKRVGEVLELVEMSNYASRLPQTLSGGQAQRVAVARALAPEPAVLLLDEPFSALDSELRVQVRRDVKRLLNQLHITTIVVTHDREEAFAMADQVAVMDQNTIRQVGTPVELYENPANPWIAKFVGEGIDVVGTVIDGQMASVFGWLPVRLAGPLHSGSSTQVTGIVRPEQLRVTPDGDALVSDIEYYGHDVLYDVELSDGTSASVRSASSRFQPGDKVKLVFAGDSIPAWPTATESDQTDEQ